MADGTTPEGTDGASLAADVVAGDRRALARAITLVESTRDDHRKAAHELLAALLPVDAPTIRLGVSGAPGAGKSTLIEALGQHVIDADHRVAVLAVDPSSSLSGGSILGDKTRMTALGRNPSAFIRPSPTAGALGGIARRTREAMLVCEAAGFDVVIIETVGVGQSEIAVADLVDLFLLVAAPGAGDELQGIKRGIMELADMIFVNKADGDLEAAATRTAADLRPAVHLLRPRRPGAQVPVLLGSALSGLGVAELWANIEQLHGNLGDGGVAALRADQNVAWMWRDVTDALDDLVRADANVRRVVATLESDVARGALAPTVAATRLLDAFLGRTDGPEG
ncbi:MAG: methylmalonyl Co-A mutase-associated GTPase MeaB [Microthrixaceae bacterium]